MKLYSTNNRSLAVAFKEAVFNSMPNDEGLYMPTHIPKLSDDFIENLSQYTFQEIAFQVAQNLLKETIPANDLKNIIDDVINFDAPIINLDTHTYILELFHGPSLAFKDFGARFMSRIMSYFLEEGEKELHILVATSGDTGGAVALGFLNVPNTRVTILFPKGKVSPIQKMQLTTNSGNICAIEVDGTFDDCQALVKQAFIDPDISQKLRLTSANSINIARLIPQSFYYFYAYAQLQQQKWQNVTFSVPSGNFGNMAAGILAWKMGLPVKQFLAATNINDTVPLFLNTGIYKPKSSQQTYSNAMDVGNPSNWVRIMDMFEYNISLVQTMIKGYSFSDEATMQAINTLYKNHNKLVCPHTVIAWLGLKEWQAKNKDEVAGVVFATAHPCKFPEILVANLDIQTIELLQLNDLATKESKCVTMGKSFIEFKQYLMENHISVTKELTKY